MAPILVKGSQNCYYDTAPPTVQFCEFVKLDFSLVPYDAVNRNKVSIHQLVFIFLLSHYMFRPLRAMFR
jgi:hypothetical protein